METFMNGAIVIEGMVLSFLLALWMTWMALRGLFRLLPGAPNHAEPARFAANGQGGMQRGTA